MIILFIIFISTNISNVSVNKTATAKTSNNVFINLNIDNKYYKISDLKNKNLVLTDYQKKNEYNYELKKKQILKMKQMGFNDKDIVSYLYPYLYNNILEVIKNEEILPCDARVEIIKNSANLNIINEKNGLKLNKNYIFSEILYNIMQNKSVINVKKIIQKPQINTENLKNKTIQRGMFVTEFKNSNEERKNNIKIALNSLDGYVIKNGEMFSFNDVVGKRSVENGYKVAKIISKGKFVDSIGGGVCQVSTTLYNCALLSGLDIIEVNSHSLKIGYVEPGFDAMVNMGSSDLKMRNNTGSDIYITTSSKDDLCKIVMYGVENKYLYKRLFECVEIKIDDVNIIQPGYLVKTKLLVYDGNELVDIRNLREIRYKPLIKDVC